MAIDSEDTGEFLAIDHALTEAIRKANGRAGEVTKLKRTLSLMADMVHQTYHDDEYNEVGWERCRMTSCRLAVSALS